jgi:hypothetical protein
MDNKTLGGRLAAIIVSIAVTAFFMSIFIYLLWPAVFPKLVAEGYIVGKLSLALSLGVAILFTCLFKSESKK